MEQVEKKESWMWNIAGGVVAVGLIALWIFGSSDYDNAGCYIDMNGVERCKENPRP